MGRLIVIMGGSASGKTTLIKYLKQNFNIKEGVSHTTRKPRINEIQGVDYHFISEEEFADMSMGKQFLEGRTYHTKTGVWFYGLHKDSIKLTEGDYFTILDEGGYYQLLENMSQEDVVGIYLYADEREKINRALSRETRTDIQFYQELYRRMLDDLTAFKKVVKDPNVLQIENNNLEQTARIVMSYIGLHKTGSIIEK